MNTDLGKPSVTLKKLSDTFKINIPDGVERIIRHLCNRVHNVEWSGILFYTFSGAWEDDSLEITCVDILPMDIGTSTYTDFNMSPDVIAYMTENDLLDCECGLIHSHNNMATFFSGTDTDTLLSEGRDRNHFVSLIVNNAGTYTAAITRHVGIEETVFMRTKYNTFNDVEVQLDLDKKCDRKYSVVEYKMLDICRTETQDDFEYIDDRLTEIRKAKETAKLSSKREDARQLSIWDDYPDRVTYGESCKGAFENYGRNNDKEPLGQVKSSAKDAEYCDDFVYLSAAKFLTGSLLITDVSKFDFSGWMKKMDSICEKTFGDMPDSEKSYKFFLDSITDLILYDLLPGGFIDWYHDDLASNMFIEAIIDFLKTLPKCRYGNMLIEHLTSILS